MTAELTPEILETLSDEALTEKLKPLFPLVRTPLLPEVNQKVMDSDQKMMEAFRAKLRTQNGTTNR